jgi:hypothetical protein
MVMSKVPMCQDNPSIRFSFYFILVFPKAYGKANQPQLPSFIAKGKSRIKNYVHKLITLGKGF